MSAAQIFIIVILFAVGIIVCVLNHYKMGAKSWSDQRKRQQPSTRQQQYSYSLTPTTASMMFTPAATLPERPTREEQAYKDHVVRLKSVRNDLALNLPHTISLPDGEEGPGCQYKHIRLHDPEQHAEITCSFIRPPPNRTISNCTPVPYFSSNSVGHFPKHPTLTLAVPRYNYAHNSRPGFPQEPCVSPPPCAPSAAAMNSVAGNPAAGNIVAANVARKSPTSGANGNSKRTCDTQQVTDNQYDESDDPPPPYSDVVSQLDVNAVNRQHYSGV